MDHRRRATDDPRSQSDRRTAVRGTSRRLGHRRRSLALVFAAHYFAGQGFAIVARLPTATTIEILDGPDDQGVPVVPRPDEYLGYVVRFDRLGTPVYSFLFATDLLQTGGRYRFSGDVTYFDGTLNLVSTPIVAVGGRGP